MTQIDQREIREAIQAGEAALRSLERAMEKMGSAKNWGIFDMMGGGLFSSLFKHSKIDRASADIEEAKRQLAVFKRDWQLFHDRRKSRHHRRDPGSSRRPSGR